MLASIINVLANKHYEYLNIVVIYTIAFHLVVVGICTCYLQKNWLHATFLGAMTAMKKCEAIDAVIPKYMQHKFSADFILAAQNLV